MTEIFDPHAALIAAGQDRAAAWRFIAEFAAYWRRPLAEDDGWCAAELDAAERRLGLRLPTALREALRLVGRRDDLTRNHNRLLRPDELFVHEGALVFREENQGCAHWGVLLADLDQDDPGTVVRPDLADKSQERWESWTARVSLACVETVMFETVLDDDGLTDHLDASGPELDLARRFRELPRLSREIRWFTGPEVLIADIDDGAWTSVRARTAQALESLREELDGDWLNG
ncbi:SMI1/KNR4 family protein [Kitasatospora sp. NBC_01287]|uniref:SMI1/KNR4 family protein n=1 Tax=Kitasatospora sp. NBC_01287 TaxID=2903573 RepID=UPI00224DD22C|nr:SMI1/KNR4 family protein [Kitasatospora sp. NBC_01287]MCX4749365.1 SMI1/KNR4 family protein [Kitasatospora sp. NBC_01287]